MSECDEWEGRLNAYGYGVIHNIGAHRMVWMQEYGHLRSDEYVLHSCDNPRCINLNHLRVGTAADNTKDMMRRRQNKNGNVYKTHCHEGHEFTDKNTYWHRGKRNCRECGRVRWRAWNNRKKEAV